jgi:hypothetical protein
MVLLLPVGVYRISLFLLFGLRASRLSLLTFSTTRINQSINRRQAKLYAIACALCFFLAQRMDHQGKHSHDPPLKERVTSAQPLHTIAVVAKCPIPGKSKTRLIPLLGQDGSAQLAQAMLSDVLGTLSECVSITYIILE